MLQIRAAVKMFGEMSKSQHSKKLSGTNHHMSIDWSSQELDEANTLATNARIETKASIISRVGAQVLSTGAGGWRVRDAVNRVSRALGVTTSVSLGLCDITCSVRSETDHCTQTVVLPESGVNTNKIIQLGEFLREIDAQGEASAEVLSSNECTFRHSERSERASASEVEESTCDPRKLAGQTCNSAAAEGRSFDSRGALARVDAGCDTLRQSPQTADAHSSLHKSCAPKAHPFRHSERSERASASEVEESTCDPRKLAGQTPFTVGDYHEKMDAIAATPPLYSPAISGLASAVACGAFTFLLGGGIIEMVCAAAGAGVGQFVRRLLLARKINQLLSVGVAVALSCAVYVALLFAIGAFVPGAASHQVGYIGAMLFVIPGFPLITSCLDMFMFDMRSGIERMTYAVVTIVIATVIGWLLAMAFQLKPGDFDALPFTEAQLCGLRFVAAFVGVFGFSIMFNSPLRVALIAGVIGGVSDTLNLELVNAFGAAPEIGAFAGALLAGLLAGSVWSATKLSRTAFTVPSIVIMIPGLYLYKAMFYMASFETIDALTWLIRAVMVILFLPLGLAAARAITDVHWRHTS